jgi:hypothetical protein
MAFFLSATPSYGNSFCVQKHYEQLAKEGPQLGIAPSEAEALVRDVASSIGLDSSTVVVFPCGQSTKAHAYYADGKIQGVPKGDYIVYNPTWVREVIGDDRVQAIALFGHEIAHHLHRDFTGSNVPDIQKETRADQFAGCAVARLGGDWSTLENLFSRLREDIDSTYPSRLKSLEAAKQGFERCQGMAFSKCPTVKSRTKVVLYPYRGLGGIDPTAAYSDLETFLSEKMRNIGAYFSNLPEAKYLENLCVEKSLNKPKTLVEFIAEWRKHNALLQMDGVITRDISNSNENIAKSSVYFGDLSQIMPSETIKAIHTDLKLDANQYETISDTHSAATLFGLVVHAKGDGLPTAYYLRLAGLARETLNAIKAEGRENQDIKVLRCTLERFISDTTKQPIPTECQ